MSPSFGAVMEEEEDGGEAEDGVQKPSKVFAPSSRRGSSATVFDKPWTRKSFGHRDSYGFNAPSAALQEGEAPMGRSRASSSATLIEPASPSFLWSKRRPSSNLAEAPEKPVLSPASEKKVILGPVPKGRKRTTGPPTLARSRASSSATLIDTPPTPRSARAPSFLASPTETVFDESTLTTPPPRLVLPSIPKRTHSLRAPPSPLLSPEPPLADAVLEAEGEKLVAPILPEVAPGVVVQTRWRTRAAQWIDTTTTKLRPPTIKYGYYSVAACAAYFGLVGFPIWNGVLYSVWTGMRLAEVPLGFLIFSCINWAFVFFPLIFGRYETPEPVLAADEVREKTQDCALLVPCYKAAGALPNTIRAALEIFPKESIFIVDNGNTPKGTDASEEVCKEWGVNYLFVPVGSKIGAEYVGISQKKMDRFKYVMVIDDDVELPRNLPLVTDRFEKNPRTGCVGYTLQSTGAEGSRGTMIQQLQDLEYRLSGLRHCMGAKYGSATFPHGAIILWKREVFVELFQTHPGYKISEDLCFGLICRESGRFIDFCSSVAVATETPPMLGLDAINPFDKAGPPIRRWWKRTRRSIRQRRGLDLEAQDLDEDAGPGLTRGGYGELTVIKQRYERWAFMHAYMLLTLQPLYHIRGWNLGWRTPVAQLLQFQDTISTLMYILMPLILPCSFFYNAQLTVYTILVNTAFGLAGGLIFNAYHLRGRPEGRIGWLVPFASVPYRFVLRFTQLAAIYRGIFRYGLFFQDKTYKLPSHPKLGPMAKRLSKGEEA